MAPFAQVLAAPGQMMPGQGMGGGMMGGWGWLGLLFWLVLLVVVVAVVWRLLQGRGESRGAAEESPLDILKRRYARGEIDREEFEAKKRDLSL